MNQPALRKELTLIAATALVVSNMIGTGIFTTTGFLAGDLGRPSLVLGIWLVGAVMVLAGCLSYAELGINFPHSGGEYVYLREAWGPAWGFMTGCVSFLAGFSAPVALSAMGFAEYLSTFYPALRVSQEGPKVLGILHITPGPLLAIALIVGFAFINILGVSLAGRLQSTLTVMTLVVLALFLVLAFAIGDGHWQNLALETARASRHSIPAQFAASLVFVMFAYSGWNAAAYVAEELKDPERALPLALLGGAGLVALLYFALNVAFIYALPLASLKGVVPVGATAARALFGDRVGGFFVIVMALALFGCISAMSLVGPRVTFAMARDGAFFESAARLHPRWHTPVLAILFQSAGASVLVLTGTFKALIAYVGFALVLFASLATAGLFRLRKRPGWKRTAAVNWWYPLVPMLFLLSTTWMLIFSLTLYPKESALGLLTIALGGVIYHLKYRKAAVAKEHVARE
ncbi:MAG: amino acid permease [Acidobacteria bacterium]|nr:amino acid permease [Acidobacteriota bacterium]